MFDRESGLRPTRRNKKSGEVFIPFDRYRDTRAPSKFDPRREHQPPKRIGSFETSIPPRGIIVPLVPVTPESIIIPIVSCILGFPLLALMVICCLRRRAKLARERARRRNCDLDHGALSLVRFSPVHRLGEFHRRISSIVGPVFLPRVLPSVAKGTKRARTGIKTRDSFDSRH